MGQVNLNERLSQTRVRLDRQRKGASESAPKFMRLTRKETRVREDQYAELSALARSLMRDRVSRRERITENTLIRIAIDLLLAHRADLRGSDEDELRQSVTPGVPDFRSSEDTDSGSSEVSESRRLAFRNSRSAGFSRSQSREDRDSGTSAHAVPRQRSGS